MFTKVLIPFDFSDDSYYIVKCLEKIPRIREILLVHVTRSLYLVNSEDRENPETDYARLRLEKVKETIEMPRSKIKIIVEEIAGGEISEAILRIADRECVSLIMMGRRGRGVIETLLLGSTAWDIIRYGKQDLLLVHPPETKDTHNPIQRYPCPDLLSRVMICTDFTEPPIENLLPDIYEVSSSVILFHAVTTGDSDEEVQKEVESAKGALHTIEQHRKDHDITSVIRTGDAADEILTFSMQEDISLIAMKSTGKQGIVQSFIGGTTAAVARNAKKPLLILKRQNS